MNTAETMRKPEKLQIRNSTAEFLIFTRQAGEDGIEVRVEDETVWLTQKLMAALFDVDVRTINEHLGNIYSGGEQVREATVRKFRIVRFQSEFEKYRIVQDRLFESDFDRHIKKALKDGNEPP